MKKEKKYGKITVFVVFFKKSITFALALKKKYFKFDSLAQQVEHIPFKDGVLGSSPRRITPKKVFISEDLLFFTPGITNDIQPVISCLS